VIIKKSPSQLEKMRRAGRALAEVFAEFAPAVRPGAKLKDLDALAEKLIRDRGATPSFLGYKGFPGSICASPNEVIVHGIPTARRLEEGDIFSADIGLVLNGWQADSAWTYPVGEIGDEARRLLEATEQALYDGVEKCRPGNRLGDVSNAIQKTVEKAGFSIVRNLGGHGIGRQMHEDPSFVNYGPPGRGPRLEPGIVLAVEPITAAHHWENQTLPDNWTVVTNDGSLSAHFEHTVAITESGPEIFTTYS
jgi:methionyl aminopeptidase